MYGMVWYGMIRCGMVWYVLWYGIRCNEIASRSLASISCFQVLGFARWFGEGCFAQCALNVLVGCFVLLQGANTIALKTQVRLRYTSDIHRV